MTLVDQHLPPPNGGGGGGGGGSELDKLWSLLGELSNQLSHNRQQTEELHRRAEELKTQAVHTQTGFTLRRFNVDVSKEEFETELERLNVSLVLENQSLQQENRQLSVLLKDYEGTLEAVMAKFRGHAHATQQHHLDLVRHYESILLSLPSTDTSGGGNDSPSTSSSSAGGGGPSTVDPLHLQLSLAHLGSLVRKALRSLQGEDPDQVVASPMLFPSSGSSNAGSEAGESEGGGGGQLPGMIHAFESASQAGAGDVTSAGVRREERDVSTGGYIGRSASTNPHYIPTTSTSSLVNSPPRTTIAPGVGGVGLSQEGAGGGGGAANHEEELRGPVDDALEREIELEQLRRENEELRRLLGISLEMQQEEEGEGWEGGES